MVGASLVDPGEADVEEDDDTQHDEQAKLKGATFQIVGTVSSQMEEKCTFIAEEYSVNKSQLQHYAEDMHFISCCQLYFFIASLFLPPELEA